MIPDYQTLMRPLLELSKYGEISIKTASIQLAKQFQISEEEFQELLPSGKQSKFTNRVGWAKTYLKKAGLVKTTKRGHFIITAEGEKALAVNQEINNNVLKKYTPFQDFQNRTRENIRTDNLETDNIIECSDITPDEILRKAHKAINDALALELISSIRECSPAFFEQLIVDLLISMGYGGTTEDAGRALGRSGDNGVDGVIDQDPLGVDQIYIQAKRYQETNTVGPADIRDFFGSLSLKKATKGIFVTTSSFTSSAIQTSKDLSHRIVLIDGNQLAKLMIRYNIGCRDEDILHLKKIDEDYFDTE